ncbi:MAG: CUB domain-containing protein [Bacteroidia bacterium]
MKNLLLFFGALSVFYGQEYKRCGTGEYYQHKFAEDPSLIEIFRQNEERIRQWIAAHPQAVQRTGNVLTVPVVVHVVYRTTLQNIPNARIDSQLKVLNEDYRRLNADRVNTPAAFAPVAADCEIQFCLANRDPNGRPTTGITRTQTTKRVFPYQGDSVKSFLKGGVDPWPSDQYLNIWVCNLGNNLLGYAQFPGDNPATDGVVIHYQAFGRNNPGLYSSYNKGRTTTHEIGHWLNLRHVWGDDQNLSNTCSQDDGVSDTPPQSVATYGCPTFPKTDVCSPTSPGIMFMNYMDYADDRCANLFTQGQKTRMWAAINNFRSSLFSSPGCAGPNSGCVGRQTRTAYRDSIADGSGPNAYTNNADCEWLISPPGARQIKITFRQLNLQPGDTVYVYDGNTTSAPRLGAFSGNSLPDVLYTSGGTALVRFKTNASGTADGFELLYEVDLGCVTGLKISDPTPGTLEDGSGPADYPNSLNCRWTFDIPSAQAIQISFNRFETEANRDFFTFYDSTTATNTKQIRRFSGNTLPPKLTSALNKALIVYTSNANNRFDGWELTYTPLNAPLCDGTTMLTALQDTFDDGSGPNSYYANRANCTWLIEPPDAISINLILHQLSTETSKDFVRIYDGASPSDPLLREYTGSITAPETLQSRSGRMLVTFSSNSSITDEGFLISYKAITPADTIHNPNSLHAFLSGYRIYPVPASEVLHIEATQAALPTQVDMTDITGRKLFTARFTDKIAIPLHTLSAGLYLLRLERGGISRHYKIQIQP